MSFIIYRIRLLTPYYSRFEKSGSLKSQVSMIDKAADLWKLTVDG
jgi:hypothetical protein